jgi:hypothetical protein
MVDKVAAEGLVVAVEAVIGGGQAGGAGFGLGDDGIHRAEGGDHFGAGTGGKDGLGRVAEQNDKTGAGTFPGGEGFGGGGEEGVEPAGGDLDIEAGIAPPGEKRGGFGAGQNLNAGIHCPLFVAVRGPHQPLLRR